MRCPARMDVALLLLLPLSCVTSPDGAPEGVRPRAETQVVRTDELPGGRLRLTFEPVAPDPALEQMRVEEARAVLAALYDSLPPKDKSRLRLVLSSTGTSQAQPAPWELRLSEVCTPGSRLHRLATKSQD